MCGGLGEPFMLLREPDALNYWPSLSCQNCQPGHLTAGGHSPPAEAPGISSARFLHVARREARGLSALALALLLNSGPVT